MIQSSTCILRAPKDQDESILSLLRNDIALQTDLLSVPRPNSSERVQQWISRRMDDPNSLFFVIAEHPSDRCVGFIQIDRINLVHRTGWLGVALRELSRGQGLGSEAIRLCETFAQEQFGLRKLLLEVRANNDTARHVYEKLNYQDVGLLESHIYAEGEFHDVVLMEKFLTNKENQKSWWRFNSQS